jgi:transglutaminase-like putative cysteine protease
MNKKEDRWWDLAAVFCFFAALLITSFRLEATEWANEFVILKWLTSIGFLLGLGMGYSDFKPPTIRFLSFCYSILILPWLLMLPNESTLLWSERLGNLVGRYNASLYQYFNNIRIEDPLLFITLISSIVWFTAIIGGYSIIRYGKPWLALIISGITLFVTEFYYITERNLFSAAFLIFSLLLLSQTNFMHSLKKWRKKGTLVEFETEFNIGRSALLIGIVLVLLVWNFSSVVATFTPGSIQQKKISGLFEQVRNEFVKITTPLQGPLVLQQEYYGETIGLGTGAVLGDDIVFKIESNRFKPPGSRFYWRARTYDQYINYQWNNTINNEIEYSAGEESSIYTPGEDLPERIFTFHPEINLGLLYTPIYPLEINRNATLVAKDIPDSGLDLVAVTTERTIYSGETYQVRSYIDNPTIWELRESSTEYPTWVTEHYLQLPPDFPPSIRQLAEEITQDEETAYDKTFAITLFLRNNIEYKEQIPSPPKNQDPIEWFLFDLKQGFCNYYASAEVLMLRSIGIPARMVFGYAQGEEDLEDITYTVRRKQSHAWPEVYFGGFGWVEFEPTRGQPALTRLVGNPSDPDSIREGEIGRRPNQFDREAMEALLEQDTLDDIENIAVGNDEAESIFSKLKNWLPLFIIIFLVDLIILITIRNKRLGYSFKTPMYLERFFEKRGWQPPGWLSRWSYFVQLPDYQRAFSSIVWSLYFLRQQVSDASTPAYLVNQLTELMPSLQTKANHLLVEYQKAFYSNYQPDVADMQKLGKEIFKETIIQKIKKWFISENPEEYSPIP